MEPIVDWLLEQEPWVQYRTRMDLLGQPLDHPEVEMAYQKMLDHPLVQELLVELPTWPGSVLKRHNDASLLLHKLVFAAEIGLKRDIPEIKETLDRIISTASDEGPFPVLINMPTHFGGSGLDEYLWLLCDAPLISYALAMWGLNQHPAVQESVRYMVGMQRDNGWPCGACPELGPKFKGPGRRDAPCPYANLLMLRLLSVVSGYEKEARTGTETLLDLWTDKKSRKPFLFAMGTHFGKLKAPFIWYDLLHVAEVLSRFPWVVRDERFRELLAQLTSQGEVEGKFRAGSVWRAWKSWDFGQKREPSGWITFCVHRLLQRTTSNKIEPYQTTSNHSN